MLKILIISVIIVPFLVSAQNQPPTDQEYWRDDLLAQTQWSIRQTENAIKELEAGIRAASENLPRTADLVSFLKALKKQAESRLLVLLKKLETSLKKQKPEKDIDAQLTQLVNELHRTVIMMRQAQGEMGELLPYVFGERDRSLRRKIASMQEEINELNARIKWLKAVRNGSLTDLPKPPEPPEPPEPPPPPKPPQPSDETTLPKVETMGDLINLMTDRDRLKEEWAALDKERARLERLAVVIFRHRLHGGYPTSEDYLKAAYQELADVLARQAQIKKELTAIEKALAEAGKRPLLPEPVVKPPPPVKPPVRKESPKKPPRDIRYPQSKQNPNFTLPSVLTTFLPTSLPVAKDEIIYFGYPECPLCRLTHPYVEACKKNPNCVVIDINVNKMTEEEKIKYEAYQRLYGKMQFPFIVINSKPYKFVSNQDPEYKAMIAELRRIAGGAGPAGPASPTSPIGPMVVYFGHFPASQGALGGRYGQLLSLGNSIMRYDIDIKTGCRGGFAVIILPNGKREKIPCPVLPPGSSMIFINDGGGWKSYDNEKFQEWMKNRPDKPLPPSVKTKADYEQEIRKVEEEIKKEEEKIRKLNERP